jgi:hypothetical protein
MVALLMAGSAAAASNYAPRYGVKTKTARHADFTKFKTYAWTTGWLAYDETVDRQVITSVDRELANLGLAKVDASLGDVLVTYAATQRTDLYLRSKAIGDPQAKPGYPVGTLIVLLLEPETRRELFRARADSPLSGDPDAVQLQIDRLVTRMFQEYPTRKVE